MARYFRHYSQQRVGSGGGKFYKPKEGENRLRIFPFLHEVQEGDFKLGRYIPGEVEVGENVQELFVQSRKHFKPTVHTCGLMKTADGRWIGSCETCDNVRAMNQGSEEDRTAARYLKASHRYAMWVVDIDDIAAGPQLYEAPQTVLDQICAFTESTRNRKKQLFGETGRNFCVSFHKTNATGGKVAPGQMYQVIMEDKEDSETLPAQDIEDLYLRMEFIPEEFQVYIEKPEPKPVQEKPEPKKKKRGPGRPRVHPEKPIVPTDQNQPDPVAAAAAEEPPSEPEPEGFQVGSRVTFDLNGERVRGVITEEYEEAEGGWLVLTEDGEGFRCDEEEDKMELIHD